MRYLVLLVACLLPATVVAQSGNQRPLVTPSPGTVLFDTPPLSKTYQEGDSLFYNADAAFFAELPGDPTDDNRSGIQRYGTRFTATSTQRLSRVAFAVNNRPEALVGTGTLRISVYQVDYSDPTIPIPLDPPLGRVDVSVADLGLGINSVDFLDQDLIFETGDEFIVLFEVVNGSTDVRVEFLIDEGSTDMSDTNYFPVRSLIFLTPPTVAEDLWTSWNGNNNFLFAAVMEGVELITDDTADGANLIAIGTSTMGAAIDPVGDVDYYKFDANAGDFFDILTENDPESSLDGRLQLFASDGTLIAENDDFGSTASSRIQQVIASAGTYFIRYSHYLNTEDFPNKQKAGDDGSPLLPVKKTSQDETGAYTLTLATGNLRPPVLARASNGLDGVIGLNWASPPNIGGPLSYRVSRATSPGGPFVVRATVGRTDYVDTSVNNGTAYYYRITTYIPASGNESSQTPSFSATPQAGGINLMSPSLSVVPVIDGSIQVQEWNDASSYDITNAFLEDLQPITVFLKNDSEALYIAVDNPNVETEGSSSILRIYYDADLNGMWDPALPSTEGRYQLDEFGSSGEARHFFRAYAGSYPATQTELFEEPPGFLGEISFTSGHSQYEVALDFTDSNLQVAPGARIGVAIALDGTNAEWPSGSVVLAPITFASLTLGAENQLPIAVATASTTETVVGDNIFFNGSASSDPDGSIASYLWDFDDGTTANTALATHAYAAPGSYSATLTVTDNDGGTNQSGLSITITTNNQLPTALFTASSTNVLTGESITFDASSSTDPDGSIVSYAWDFGDSTSDAGVSVTHSYTQPGTYTVDLTVTDDAGASGMASTAITVNERVNEAPVITHQVISEAVKGQDLTITATITDDVGITNATLTYLVGVGQSVVLDMTPSGNSYQATIPGTSIDERGLSYLIDVTDTDAEAASVVAAVRVRVPNGLTKTISSFGEAESAYRLVSVPLQLTNASVRSTLEDDLGTYDDTAWRFYALQNGENYAELSASPSLTFALGQAYWLAVREGGQQFTTGEGLSAPLLFPYEVQLVAGWNFISNPYAYNINAGFYETESGTPLDMWSYSNGWTPYNGVLRPFEGYAVLSNAADRLFIYPNFRPEGNKQPVPALAAHRSTRVPNNTNAQKQTDYAWSIAIGAQSGAYRDNHTWAAVHAQAADAYDFLDRAEPPPVPGGGLSVYFEHPDWQTATPRYSADVRSVPNEGATWSVHVASQTHEPTLLTFSDVEQVPDEFEVWLLDPISQSKQNLRFNPTYRVGAIPSDEARVFTLVVARTESNTLVEALNTSSEIPSDFVLENFPNPFNPVTTIRYGLPESSPVTLEIFNVLGERIAVLEAGSEKTAGYHTAVWDGTGLTGQPVTSGLYFYRLQTAETTHTQTMVLAK